MTYVFLLIILMVLIIVRLAFTDTEDIPKIINGMVMGIAFLLCMLLAKAELTVTNKIVSPETEVQLEKMD